MSKADSLTIRGKVIETDKDMILKSMSELWNKVGDPTLLSWQDLRALFTSHDLARCLVWYLQKEKFDAQKVEKQTIEVPCEVL